MRHQVGNCRAAATRASLPGVTSWLAPRNGGHSLRWERTQGAKSARRVQRSFSLACSAGHGQGWMGLSKQQVTKDQAGLTPVPKRCRKTKQSPVEGGKKFPYRSWLRVTSRGSPGPRPTRELTAGQHALKADGAGAWTERGRGVSVQTLFTAV